jgi:hypothetical protein
MMDVASIKVKLTAKINIYFAIIPALTPSNAVEWGEVWGSFVADMQLLAVLAMSFDEMRKFAAEYVSSVLKTLGDRPWNMPADIRDEFTKMCLALLKTETKAASDATCEA